MDRGLTYGMVVDAETVEQFRRFRAGYIGELDDLLWVGASRIQTFRLPQRRMAVYHRTHVGPEGAEEHLYFLARMPSESAQTATGEKPALLWAALYYPPSGLVLTRWETFNPYLHKDDFSPLISDVPYTPTDGVFLGGEQFFPRWLAAQTPRPVDPVAP